MKYIFIAGAPGSRWSSVARSIYQSSKIDNSDSDEHYIRPNETTPMHVGTYWDPGMEYGENFDVLDTMPAEYIHEQFNLPFTEDSNLTRIIKSHQFCKHLDFIRDTWEYCPIVLVHYKNNDATENWWYDAGGFDISYPDYRWYRNRMREEIEMQNAAVLDFVQNNDCKKVTDSIQLGELLGFDDLEYKDFATAETDVYVYMPHLIDYFGKSWQGNLQKYQYSGLSLLDKIDKSANILDIGCGVNFFKQYFTNLTGIDPSNPRADYIVALEEFVTDSKYDAVLCLGSLNFGSEEKVYSQTKLAVELTKSNGVIYWRCNPGLHDHEWKGMELINFFPWSFELHEKWSRQLGCELVKCTWDTDDRIYAEWRKL
jgi:hypothetical protein